MRRSRSLLSCANVLGPLCRVAAALLALGCSAWPQATDSDRMKLLEQQLAAERHLLRDWGGLTRYGSENTELRMPAAGDTRVGLLGHQIPDFLSRRTPKFF